eukprot:4499165-Prymnesium_polylepis.1
MEKQRERDGDRDDPNKSDADGNVDPATVATNQAIEMVKQLSIALRGQQLILGMLQVRETRHGHHKGCMVTTKTRHRLHG